MAKRVDPLKAKQAKQKKMAIGLSVLFVAVLAFQGPKTLKMLKGPSAATPTAAAPTTATADPNVPPAAPTIDGVAPGAAPTATAAGAAQPAVLVDSDVPVEADDGQLRSFELFQAKDPFKPQGGGVEVAGGSPAGEPASTPVAEKPTTGSTIVPPSSTGSGTANPTPTPTPTAPAAPTAAPASATSISVNGIAADVAIDKPFPVDDPAFVLVSVARDGKSVQIGVAGGAYADGAQTIKLTLRKQLTLRNTADGTQYVLLLNAVAGFVPPKQ